MEKMRMLQTGRSSMNRAAGFTLMELLVVIMILGFFSAFLSLRIENVFSGGDLRLASRVLMGEIKKFRGRAAYSHKEQVMGFKVGRNILYPVESIAEGETGSGWVSEDKTTASQTTYLPEGVILEDVVTPLMGKIQEGEARIRFFGNGCVERSLIHLRNERDEAYTLEINPLTGHVRVHDGYVDQRVEP